MANFLVLQEIDEQHLNAKDAEGRTCWLYLHLQGSAILHIFFYSTAYLHRREQSATSRVFGLCEFCAVPYRLGTVGNL
jgi:hypothetical protein